MKSPMNELEARVECLALALQWGARQSQHDPSALIDCATRFAAFALGEVRAPETKPRQKRKAAITTT